MIVPNTDTFNRRFCRALPRIALVTAVALALALVGVTVWFVTIAHLSLPKLDGASTLPGLHSRVTIARDAQGVPHITAATPEDLFFAQGYVTAQDRLWQMDMLRRYAAGELAEVLGSTQVEHDRQQRILLMREVAANAAANLSPRDRAFMEAYARGVNAYIDHQKVLPVEFHVLGYRPRPWTVTDSFLVATTMLQKLTLATLPHQLSRERINSHLSPELAADLYPNSSWRDHPPTGATAGEEMLPSGQEQNEEDEEQRGPAPAPPPQRVPTPRRRVAHPRAHPGRRIIKAGVMMPDRLVSSNTITNKPDIGLIGAWPAAGALRPRPDEKPSDPLSPGSNNWVLSGAHTVSGRPLLSNDMHLAHQIPNAWYEVHLTSGNFDVAGISLPGLPMVVVGHNQRIAWGFTNLGAAVSDLYIESVNGRGEYLTPEGWRQPEHRHEVIRVRWGWNRKVDVAVTRHGPIVTELFPEEKRPLALKWTAYDPGTVELALFDMNSAQNWEQFREALRHFGSPAQNVVYADVDGHIGYQAAGKIPQRAAGDGSVPVSGADNGHEWTGYIPFDRLPSVLDPPSGVLVTANGRITPDGYPLAISNEWAAPYRTERIAHVLESDRKFTSADMLALQLDIQSDFDRFCAQRFVYSIDHSSQASARVHQAAELMRDWNGQVAMDSAAATIVLHSAGNCNVCCWNLNLARCGAIINGSWLPCGWRM